MAHIRTITYHGIRGLDKVFLYRTKGGNTKAKYFGETVKGRVMAPHSETQYFHGDVTDDRVLRHPAVGRCITWWRGQKLVSFFRAAIDRGEVTKDGVTYLNRRLKDSFGSEWTYTSQKAQQMAGAWLMQRMDRIGNWMEG